MANAKEGTDFPEVTDDKVIRVLSVLLLSIVKEFDDT